MLGLGTVFLVLLFKSHAGFVNSFNQFAGSITGEPDTYNTVIAERPQRRDRHQPGIQHGQHLADLGRDLRPLALRLALDLHLRRGAAGAGHHPDEGHEPRRPSSTSRSRRSSRSSSSADSATTSSSRSTASAGRKLPLRSAALLHLPDLDRGRQHAARLVAVHHLRGCLSAADDPQHHDRRPHLLRLGARRPAAHRASPGSPPGPTRPTTRSASPWPSASPSSAGPSSTTKASSSVLVEAVAAAAGDDDPARRSRRSCCPTAGPRPGAPRRPPGASSGSRSSPSPAALVAVLLAGLFFVYIHYPDLGIDKGQFFRDCAIVLGAALLTFFVARTARLRQGVDVDKLAAEIPPE